MITSSKEVALSGKEVPLCELSSTGKACQEGVPVSEYVREMVHDHILQRGARFRETGGRLRVLSNAVKTWLIAYHECVAVAAGLPGRRV